MKIDKKPKCFNKREHDGDCLECNWFNACDNVHDDSHFQYNPLCMGKDLNLHDGSICIHCAQPSPEDMADFHYRKDFA